MQYTLEAEVNKWRQGCILPFPKKRDLREASDYRGSTLKSVPAKIYQLNAT